MGGTTTRSEKRNARKMEKLFPKVIKRRLLRGRNSTTGMAGSVLYHSEPGSYRGPRNGPPSVPKRVLGIGGGAYYSAQVVSIDTRVYGCRRRYRLKSVPTVRFRPGNDETGGTRLVQVSSSGWRIGGTKTEYMEDD